MFLWTKVLLLFVYCYQITYGFTYSDTIPNLMRYSNISASSTCGGCNSTCPTRNGRLQHISTPLTNKDSENCSDIHTDSLPGSANKTFGTVMFNSSTENCTWVDYTLNTTLSRHFTVSVWIKVHCSKCRLMSVGSTEVRQEGTSIRVASTNGPSTSDNWQHIVFRYNGYISLLVNGLLDRGIENANLTSTVASPIGMELGPGDNVLSSNNTISMVDARVYNGALTDREIAALYAGTYDTGGLVGPTSATADTCRCPGNAPSPSPFIESYFSVCTNNRDTYVSVFNPLSGHPLLAIDEDLTTSWNSDDSNDVTLTVTLAKRIQIKELRLVNMQSIPQSITIELKVLDNLSGRYTFPESCSSGDDCLGSGNFTYNFELDAGTPLHRSTYDSLLADTITIQLKGHQDFPSTYGIGEIELEARCDCTGSGDCLSPGPEYTCNCTGLHTRDEHCQACTNGFFRSEEEFACTKSCACNTFGSATSDCEEVGGQCPCKGNTEGRQCDTCKELSVNLGNDTVLGCQTCPCNPLGVISPTCSSDLTCTCKNNTEPINCTDCLQDFYNITSEEGCMACGCDEMGTRSSTYCNTTDGQCACKQYTEGRTCNSCQDNYYELRAENPEGCKDCDCSVGAFDQNCDKVNGQCRCRDAGSINRQCKPILRRWEPLYGPTAGGTRVTVSGELLWFEGSFANPTIYVQGQPNAILTVDEASSNNTMIVFTTNAAGAVGNITLVIVWLVPKFEKEENVFTYKENPVNAAAFTGTPSTFLSGGCSVMFTGEHLNNVARPSFLVYDAKQQLISSERCVHVSDQVRCLTPNLGSHLNLSTGQTLHYGLGLDGLNDYRNISVLRIVPDPVPNNKSILFHNTFDKEIVIEGSNFLSGCISGDIRVTIGTKDCPIKSGGLTDTKITCEPNEPFPGTEREDEIMIHFGTRSYTWGTVRFTSFWKLTQFLYICVGIGCFLLVVIVVVVLIFCLRRRRKPHSDRGIPITGFDLPNVQPNPYVSGNGMSNRAVDETSVVDHSGLFIDRLQNHVGKAIKLSLVERSQVQFGSTCTDKGKHIRVINGTFSSSSLSSDKPLTIKTLISNYEESGSLPSWLNEGLYECTRLRDHMNTNVLQLLGIAVDSKKVYVLYPEMRGRTLKHRLANTKKNPLSDSERLGLCVQVAEGMNYLDTEHVVHKDLAARNCMIDSEGVVKISDSSFSWDLFPDEYLYKQGRYLPLRWMAPESLQQAGFYDSKSDVWSFGVLMWEVFTDGCLPYQEIDVNEVQKKVCNDGFRLAKPYGCSDTVYKIIQLCHETGSCERPNFFLIINHLTEVIDPSDEGGLMTYENTSSLRPGYVNAEQLSQEIYANTEFQAAEGNLPAVPPWSRRQ